MSDSHAAYPDYAATARLDELRAAEYSYLDAGGHTYLDYTGAGLAADAQLRAHAERLRAGCFGNPHSDNPTSSASTRLIEQARNAVLRHFNAAADGLAALKHGNGTPMVRVYGPGPGQSRGGTVTFNFLDPHGAVVDERTVARDASAAGISVRTGCFCNPGAGERAFGLSQQDVGGAWWRGGPRRDLRTVDDYLKRAGLPSGSAVRVSLGLVSNLADVERFLDFAEQTYRDAEPVRVGLPPRLRC
jgi:selenocysteine lyase/cysteine desulfurase